MSCGIVPGGGIQMDLSRKGNLFFCFLFLKK